MDVSAITTLIGSLGFPIVCCVGMAYYINGTMKEFTSTVRENTITLEKLISKIDLND